MEVHLIWHNPKDPQNLGGGLGPEQQAWEVGPSRTCMDGCTHTPQPDMDGNKHTQCSRTWMDGRTHTHTAGALSPPPPPLQEQAALSAAGWGWPHTGPFVHHVPGHCPGVRSPVVVALGEEEAGAGWPCGKVQLGGAAGNGGPGSRHQGTSHCAGATAFISPPGVVGQQPQTSCSRANKGSLRLLPAG